MLIPSKGHSFVWWRDCMPISGWEMCHWEHSPLLVWPYHESWSWGADNCECDNTIRQLLVMVGNVLVNFKRPISKMMVRWRFEADTGIYVSLMASTSLIKHKNSYFSINFRSVPVSTLWNVVTATESWSFSIDSWYFITSM